MLGCPEMADVRPFRALRYDEAKVGPLEALVAPPYDVISEDERAGYLARSPYNVVHLTLPDSEQAAARAFAEWRRDGVLARDAEPAYWLLSQEYVGPDGVRRMRNGIVASFCRMSARTAARRKGGCASSAPCGCSSSRSSCSTTAPHSSYPTALRT